MSYWLGVALAIGSGVSVNLGSVFQKKVVNDLTDEEREGKFFRTLLKRPLWLIGLLLQYAVSATFLILAQVYIGPALVPGLTAVGLVVLAVGSVKLVGESLGRIEIIGILLLMFGTVFFSMSELQIAIPEYDFLAFDFLFRLGTFTTTLIIIIITLEIVWRSNHQYHASSLALVSGILRAISAFWIAPLIATIVHVFDGTFILVELWLFIAACFTLVLSNMYAVVSIQNAFKTGQASLLIPIQQVPYQIIPGFVYMVVFFLALPTPFSLVWFLIGIGLTIVSSFLLGQRQVLLEAMTK